MEWVTTVKAAVKYMEEHLLEVKRPGEVAEFVHVSEMYLQRGFHMMTGYSMGEYLRNRRLYLAALEVMNTNGRIIDIALKYGYETPESFTKAFTRFHGSTPMEVRRRRRGVKAFLPLRISIVIKGGRSMEVIVEKQEAFQVIGFAREFAMESSRTEIPEFWEEISKRYQAICYQGKKPETEIERAMVEHHVGEYGVCVEDGGDKGTFHYMIAGRYRGGSVPEGMELYEIPGHEWAKFRCVGPLPGALQSVNDQIWNEWLPGNCEYEIAGGYNIEWYSPEGRTSDPDYQSGIWIPVKRIGER